MCRKRASIGDKSQPIILVTLYLGLSSPLLPMCKPLLHRVSSLLLQLWLITYQWGYKVNQCWSLTPEYWGVRFPNQQPPTPRLYLGPVAQQDFIHQLEEVRKQTQPNHFTLLPLNHTWVISESSLRQSWVIPKSSLRHPWGILKVSLSHPWVIPLD